MRERRAEWERRTQREGVAAIDRGCRIWFGTLTGTPSYFSEVRLRATKVLAEGGIDFDTLPEGLRFYAKERESYRDVRNYLKRVREGAKRVRNHFRYLLVSERVPDFNREGKPNVNAGEPHWHILIMETDPRRPVRQDDLDGSQSISGWVGGFTMWSLWKPQSKICPTAGLGYICKYLAKDGGQIRASHGWGKPPLPDVSSVSSVVSFIPEGWNGVAGSMEPLGASMASAVKPSPPPEGEREYAHTNDEGGSGKHGFPGERSELGPPLGVTERSRNLGAEWCPGLAEREKRVLNRVRAVFGEGCEIVGRRQSLETGLSKAGPGAMAQPPPERAAVLKAASGIDIRAKVAAACESMFGLRSDK